MMQERARFEIAKSHRAQQRREVPAERPHRRATLGARFQSHHQEYCGASERRGHRLRKRPQALGGIASALRIGVHRMSSWRAHGISLFEITRSPRVPRLRPEAYHRPARNVHAAVHFNGSLGCVGVKPNQARKGAGVIPPR